MMRRKVMCELHALALLAFVQFLFHVAQPCIAAEEVLKEDSRQFAGTAPADHEDSLTLRFNLTKDPAGRLWAHFHIHNRGKIGLLICDAMQLSFSASTADSKSDFPLHYARDDFNPIVFFRVDAPPPARATSGLTCLSRRVEVRPFLLIPLVGLQEVLPKKMKKAKLVGRVKGSVLKWDVATGEFVDVPFDISSTPAPWERFSHLFIAPVSQQEDGGEEFKPSPNGEEKVPRKAAAKAGSN